MSECGVCLSYDDYGREYYIDDWNIVECDADHVCCECGKLVKAGEMIEKATVYEDGEDYQYDDDDEKKEFRDPVYTCVVCAEVADAFYCDVRMFGGGLWDRLYDVHESMTITCLDKLQTPEAKAELQRRWMRWKGLTA